MIDETPKTQLLFYLTATSEFLLSILYSTMKLTTFPDFLLAFAVVSFAVFNFCFGQKWPVQLVPFHTVLLDSDPSLATRGTRLDCLTHQPTDPKGVVQFYYNDRLAFDSSTGFLGKINPGVQMSF